MTAGSAMSWVDWMEQQKAKLDQKSNDQHAVAANLYLQNITKLNIWNISSQNIHLGSLGRSEKKMLSI